MLQGTAVRAYKSLMKLSNTDFAPAVSYKLFKLRQELLPIWNFQLEEERKIINAIPHTEEIQVLNLNENPEIRAKLIELASVEVHLSDQNYPIHLKLSDLPNLSIDDMESLQSFVIFDDA